MKNGSTMVTQRRGNHGDHLAMLQHQPSRILEKNSCCVFGGISLMSYIMSCSNRTRPLLGLSIEHNWWDWAKYSRKNAPITTPGMTKLFSCMIMLDHMLRRWSNLLRNTQMVSYIIVLPHSPYSPDIAPSDYHLFRLMTHGCLSSTSHHMMIPKIVSMIG